MEFSAPVPLPLPCLVVDHHGAGGEPCTTLLDISKGEQYQHHACDDAAGSRRFRRWMTPHGWVLSWDTSTLATFLWSPQTSEKVDLPPLTPEQEIPLHSACSLSGKPTTGVGSFTVVAVEPEDTVVWYCHVGGDAGGRGWVRHEYDAGSITFRAVNGRSMQAKKFITRLTAVGGKFYFKSEGGLGVLDFSPAPVLSSVPVPDIERPPGTTSMALSFVELGGELYLVTAFLHYDIGGPTSVLGCGVYKLDMAGKRWRKVRDIGDQAFLMCPQYFGGCCSATASGLRPNCVYWMGLCGDNLLRVYDIDGNEGTHRVHDPCKDISGPNRNAVWMLPSDDP